VKASCYDCVSMRARSLLSLWVLAGAVGCGTTGAGTGNPFADAGNVSHDATPDTGARKLASDSGTLPTGDATAPSGDASVPSDCADGTDLVYVVSSSDNSLYSFYPPTLAFTKVGVLACDSMTSPFAMSVARDGYAWVNYDDGQVFRVSLKDATCSATGFTPGQHGFTTFGMGFSANATGSSAETLFVCWTQGLAQIDTTSLVLTPVGTMPGLDITSGCDLTGNGAGALFSFITQPTQWTLAQLDKVTSGPMWQRSLTPPIPAGGAWGTSFWGGDLYLYTAPTGNSIVWRYRPSDQTTVQLVSDVGFTIVGAGESTCVPTTAPPPK